MQSHTQVLIIAWQVRHGEVKKALADNVRSWLAANQTFPDSASAAAPATTQAPKASR